MRTDTEMMNLILQIADTLEVEASCFIRIPNESSGTQRRVSRL